jgi:[ribosomal protein S5]-alanine N-acetyltransferase
MRHKGTITLETDRLILRRLTIHDANAVFRNWASDPEVTKYLTWPTHKSIEVSTDWCRQNVDSYIHDDYYSWIIVLKSLGEPIGSIGTVSSNERVGMVHIGYCIGKPWWHQGYTSEALAVVIKFFFKEVGANRIESRFDPHNPNSGKVMEKCGLKREGTLRKADWNNQGICDSVFYAILAEDASPTDTPAS